ncbi:MAG TPA: CBS domain-containing protein [Acidimicrobiales bacterium]|jgi:CBS domain-containing protein|nr:CBS domain-containing protein [Acidimicrobiales bacterium]
MPLELLHLSSIIHRPLVDRDGERIGRIEDVVARLGGSAHPPVVGVVLRIEGRDVFVPIRKIASLERGRVRFDGRRVDLRPFERRPGEVLLAHDLLARHLINFVRGRLITANEIELANVDGTWEVVGADAGRRPLLRRLLGGRLGSKVSTTSVVDFAQIEPFVNHVPAARLRIPYRRLSKLHPAQIADLVEAASHEEGEEIIEAVGLDRELEADVFEELDTEHQLEFIDQRSDDDAARLLSRMQPDDAADLISEVEQDRRLPLLELMAEPQQRKVRNLLSYPAESAGGLMSPDYVDVTMTATAEAALAAVRDASAPLEALNVVVVLDDVGGLAGTVSLVALVRARPTAKVTDVMRADPAHVHPNWDVNRIARQMSDFNLTVVPVLDDEHRGVLGVVTVDDLLELLLGQGWRRDYGEMTAVEE